MNKYIKKNLVKVKRRDRGGEREEGEDKLDIPYTQPFQHISNFVKCLELIEMS